MAKFLDTSAISYYLQQIINQARDTLILISPYFKINERLQQSIEDKDRMKIDIRVVYGKRELSPDQMEWFKTLNYIRMSFCQNLHAKCYLNESEAIITSMNLYEFSQVNNQEMGIYVDRAEDTQLYLDICNEARRLIRISEEIPMTVEEEFSRLANKPTTKGSLTTNSEEGYCIRCRKEIAFNVSAPYCGVCYSIWKKYENPTYQEKHCHSCGKEGNQTFNKPVCYDCYQQHKDKFKTYC